MKKNIVILLMIVLIFLAGCGDKPVGDEVESTTSSTTTTTVTTTSTTASSTITTTETASSTSTATTTTAASTRTEKPTTTQKTTSTSKVTSTTTQAATNIVPEGCTYFVGAKWDWDKSLLDYTNAEIYTAGEKMPMVPTTSMGAIEEKHAFICGDYCYTYARINDYYGYWMVHLNLEITDRNQSSYSVLLSSINGEDVTSIKGLFEGCANLVTAPAIPDTITNMQWSFMNCTSLVTAPTIPNGVGDMTNTFSNCTSLVNAPAIPSSVTMLDGTFSGCTSLVKAPDMSKATGIVNMGKAFLDCTKLSGEIIVNAAFTYGFDGGYSEECFAGTTQPITLLGSVSDEAKAILAATATHGNVTY